MTSPIYDVVELTQALIRCPSVTPAQGGALDLLQARLEALGFACTRLPFSEPGTPDVDNLYARLGEGRPHLCFAGHSDVVPAGDETAWREGPFAAVQRGDVIYGCGAVDMKGAIAAFTAAVSQILAENAAPAGSISLLITGDEEGPAINGTKKMLDWLKENGQTLDHCLVGEPTNPHELGEMIKIGRRGSMNVTIICKGEQGHVAYPDRADNPLPRAARLADVLSQHVLDEGTEHFQPSNLEVTSIDTDNEAVNIIPSEVRVRINIRFNDAHSSDMLLAWVRAQCDAVHNEMGGSYELESQVSGESFFTQPGPFVTLVRKSVADVTGRTPELSTSGGTSDARFIKDVCPVVEFGLVGASMHKVNERVTVSDLGALTVVYKEIIQRYFNVMA